MPYFLHGAPTNAKTVQRIFGLAYEPKARKARIFGFRRMRHLVNWVLVREENRQSPLLLERSGQNESEVEGVAFVVSNTEEMERLETHARAEYGPK